MSGNRMHAPKSTTEQRILELRAGGRMTKFKGQVASLAPSCLSIDLGPVKQAVSSLALASGMLLAPLTVSGTAQAGGCPAGGPGSYVCAGGAAPGVDTAASVFVVGDTTVTTTSGFGIDTRYHPSGVGAFHISELTPGNLTFTDIYNSSIRGDAYGMAIYMPFFGGTVDVFSKGTISGNDSFGIQVNANPYAPLAATFGTRGPVGVNLDLGNVYGGAGLAPPPLASADGINVTTYGLTGVYVQSSGTVTGQANGVDLSSGGAVTFKGVHVSSVGGAAIDVNSGLYGMGGVEVTTTGNVTSTGGHGIRSDVVYGPTTINAYNVTAGAKGIYATASNAASNMSVTSNGLISGQSGGVHLKNTATNYGQMNVSLSSVSTTTGAAVDLDKAGSGNINLTITGTASSMTGTGIDIDKTSTGGGNIDVGLANVTALGDAVNIANAGSGNVKVIAPAGTIYSSTGAGLEITNSSMGPGYTMATVNNVYGATKGVHIVNNGSGVILLTSTAGSISSSGVNSKGVELTNTAAGTDITANVHNVGGQYQGIDINHRSTGNVSLNATGHVTAVTGDAINVSTVASTANTSVTVNSAASTNAAGVSVDHDGTGYVTVSATGHVQGGTKGIVLDTAATSSSASLAFTDVTSGSGEAIDVYHLGSGDLGLSTTGGHVQSTSSTGVSVISGAGSGAQTIGVDQVTASGDAIRAYKYSTTGNHTVTATGAVSSTNGTGLKVRNGAVSSGSSTFSVNSVNAATDGLDIITNSSGPTQVTATGTVAATTGDGIRVNTGTSASSLTINTATVTGGQDGIDATHNGASTMSITATGNVLGGTNGILATNTSAGGNVTVVTQQVYAQEHGVSVDQNGYGNTYIKTNGDVTGGDGYSGIKATSTNSSLNMTVISDSVSGGSGVYARHQGAGNLSVTSNGAVTGRTHQGIHAFNSGSGSTTIDANATVISYSSYGILATHDAPGNATDAFVYATSVSAHADAIRVANYGSGQTVVDATGALASIGMGSGLSVTSGSDTTSMALSVAGVSGRTGIDANHAGSGDSTITATGAVNGNFGRGLSLNKTGSGNASITATGSVYGYANGIYARNTAAGGDLTISAKDVSSSAVGVTVLSFGSGITSLMASGSINGGLGLIERGISFVAGGTTASIDVQDVTGGTAIVALHSGHGDFNITSGGTLQGHAGEAISAHKVGSGDLDVDLQTVNGNTGGITLSTGVGTGALSLEAGDVYSRAGRAVYAYHEGTGDLTVSLGTVGSGGDGVVIRGYAPSGAANLTAGNITAASGGTTYGVDFYARGTSASIDVQNVTAGVGIDASHAGTQDLTITASGTITGLTEDAIVAEKTGTGNVSIDVQDVSAHSVGINVETGSTAGAMSITAGDIEASVGVGVYGYHNGVGNLSIDVGDVTGGFAGIAVRGDSQADEVSISTGNAAGDYVGISVYTQAQNLSISAHDVAGRDGIMAFHLGDGDLSVTTTGTVTGGDRFGVSAISLGEGGVTIDVQDVSADGHGIAVASAGYTGSVTVTAGNVTSHSGVGVFGVQSGSGDMSITTGDVSGHIGIYAANFNAESDMMITTGDVQGVAYGINVNSTGAGLVDITTTGTVNATKGNGIYVNMNTSGADGVFGAGTVTIESQTVTASEHAIAVAAGDAASAITISAANVTSDNGVGVLGVHSGSGDMTISTGSVSGVIGIYALSLDANSNTTITAGDVQGVTYGINVQSTGSGVVDITTTGTVSATNGHGIYVNANIDPANGTFGYINSKVHEHYGVFVAAASSRNGAPAVAPSNVNISTGNVSGTKGGIFVETTQSANIEVNGVVSSASGAAIDMRGVDGASFVTLADGWGLDGQVLASGTGNGLILAGTQASRLGLDLLGNDNAANGIIGFDNLSIQDGSTWYLTGSSTSGVLASFNVSSGIAAFNDSTVYLSSGGVFDIGTFGILASFGISAIGANVSNAGLISMVDGAADDHLDITGDFAGAGGGLEIDVDVENDLADTVNIGGDVTGETTQIGINALSASEATGNDILLIEVDGDTSSDDFALAAGDDVAIGVLTYGLELQGSDWFLVGSGVTATGLAYQAMPSAVLEGFTSSSTLQQRIGARAWDVSEDNPTWLRIYGAKSTLDSAGGVSPFSMENKIWGIQAGADFASYTSDAGRWVFGSFFEHNDVSATVTNADDIGLITGSGFGVGLSATYYGDNGFYADVVGRIGKAQVDLFSNLNGTLLEDQSVSTAAASIEAGYDITLASGAVLTPQAQLSWGRIDAGSATDELGRKIDLGVSTQLEGRIGVSFEFSELLNLNSDSSELYVSGNLLRDLSKETRVSVDGVNLLGGNDATQVEIGLGGTYAWNDNATIYGQGTYRKSINGGETEGFSVSLGAAFTW